MTSEVSTKRKLQGNIVSKIADNLYSVRVETKKPHSKYGKIVKSHKKYMVRNLNLDIDQSALKVGVNVLIEESKPLSGSVYFVLVNII